MSDFGRVRVWAHVRAAVPHAHTRRGAHLTELTRDSEMRVGMAPGCRYAWKAAAVVRASIGGSRLLDLNLDEEPSNLNKI